MNPFVEEPPRADTNRSRTRETAFGYARDFLDNQLVYAVISPRARGLSIGVNVNPNHHCNFDCLYCEVDRSRTALPDSLDINQMSAELEHTLSLVLSGGIRNRPFFSAMPAELLQLRHVTLSGDGEPTLSPQFEKIVEAIIHLRALGSFPFFKIVLVTNASGLDRPEVERGLNYLTSTDEIWAKLDAGTVDYYTTVNRPQPPFEKIIGNILKTARKRPIIIQSLFAEFNGQGPSTAEIDAYANKLAELQKAGAKIKLVQVYSANRPTPNRHCKHLTLAQLSQLARRVREISGLTVQVY